MLSLIGSKDGIGHVALCFIDPGDVALVPDPGYPVYAVGTLFAGGEPYYLPLREENGFLPDLDAVPADVARRAKLLWLNYPNNPTGAVADLDFFERAVAFARRHDLAVCHDGPYSEVAFDGYRPVSFLQAAGAREVGVEFHSLSKTYNMTGWRIGMAVGNAAMIDALMRVKSNLDSGVPQAIQRMADRRPGGPPGLHRRAQRRLPAPPRPPGRGAAGSGPGGAAAEGQPLRLGARPRRLHLDGVRHPPAGRRGRGGDAGRRLRRGRRGLRAPLPHHPRRPARGGAKAARGWRAETGGGG